MAVKYLRRQPVDLVTDLVRLPFSDLAHFCPGVLRAVLGVDFPQPPRAAARDDGAKTAGDRIIASSVYPARVKAVLASQHRLDSRRDVRRI